MSKIGMPYIRLGTGAALVLIHGLGEIKEGWKRQYELSDQFDLIIPDLRGHGENSILEGISLVNYANDILSLLDELNIESAHICGLSMGGIVAQEIYKQAPEKCKSLILVNTFHYAPKLFESSVFFQTRKARSLFLSERQQMMIAARCCLYSWTPENIEEFFTFFKPNAVGHEKAAEAVLGADYRPLLPFIKVPTLIIGSQYDTVTPAWLQILMRENIPYSELVIFKDAGHISKFEAAKDFNQTLRFFLDRHEQPSRFMYPKIIT